MLCLQRNFGYMYILLYTYIVTGGFEEFICTYIDFLDGFCTVPSYGTGKSDIEECSFE